MGIFKWGRRIHRIISLLLFLAAISLLYYFLPENLHPLKSVSPSWDQRLQKQGFRVVQALDSLGLWGRDARVELSKSYAEQYTYGGFPKCRRRLKRLDNEGFIVGYSESLRDPVWVAYRLFEVPDLKSAKRPARFRTDPRTRAKVSHDDYTGSGFDRGHMAPNYAIATRFGRDGQQETFLMSNIIPQTPEVNREIWRELEMWVAKKYAQYFGEVWVVTGPVFDKHPKRLESGVAIPKAYYKIIADEDNGGVRALAFLIETNCPPLTRIKSRLVSIDEIEARTGIDFFPELSSIEQQALESRPATRLWPWWKEMIRRIRQKID